MNTQTNIVATLNFEDAPVFDVAALSAELSGMFHDVDIDLAAAKSVDGNLEFVGPNMRVEVSPGDAALTVSVGRSPCADDDAPCAKRDRAQGAACYNVVRTLQTRLAPRSVSWSDADLASADATSRRQHLKKQCQAPGGLSPKERMNRNFGTVEGEGSQFDCSTLAVAQTHKRLDRSFEAVQSEQTSEVGDQSDLADLGYGQPRTRLTAAEASRFPDLMPVELALREERRALFPSDTIALTQRSAQHETTNPTERREADDIMARLTVYVLNTILLVVAFPVGFGMLIFNILGGENLRTTAHVMALTGMGTALAAANVQLPFLSMI